jgi:hypothetical protein
MVAAEQIPVGSYAGDSERCRDRAGSPQRLLRTPEVKMLHGTLRQILALWDALNLRVTFDDYGADAGLTEPDGKPKPNWPAAGNDHIGVHPAFPLGQAPNVFAPLLIV